MFKNKNSRVASISFIAKAIKLLAAPITLLIISKQLNNTEMAFYYVFFSLVSMQQLAELGIGHTMKQYISHAYKVENGEWIESSKYKINEYYHLTKLWFLGIAIFILCVVGSFGFYYLGESNSHIKWEGAWFSLIFVSALTTQITPIILLLDSIQRQELIQRVSLYSGIFGSVSLWICLKSDLGLYSIALSSFCSLLISVFLILHDYIAIKKELVLCIYRESTSKILKEIWPLLSRVSIVWGLGFLFWNAFNLISFSVLDANTAGKIIFCVTLAKSGMNVAESIIQSQMTIFSNIIADGNIDKAVNIFNKYVHISIGILFLGYILFLTAWEIFPNFYLFDKLPSKYIVIQIFIFFLLQLYKMIRTNFTRCFKVELFLKPSIYEALVMPLTFYISMNSFLHNYAFLFCSGVILFGAIWSLKIENKFIKELYV